MRGTPEAGPARPARAAGRPTAEEVDLTRRAGGVFAMALLGVLVAAAAHADALFGRAVLTWQSYDQDDLTTEGLRERYELGVAKALSDAFELGFGARVEQDASGSTVVGDRRESDARRLDAYFRLTYARPTLLVRADGERGETRTRADLRAFPGSPLIEQVREHEHDRGLAWLSWTPHGLPALSFDAGEVSSRAIEQGTDVTQRWIGGHARYDWRGLAAAAWVRTEETEDRGEGFASRGDHEGASLDWARGFLDQRLEVNLSGLVSRSRYEDRSLGGGAVGVPVPVRVAAVLVTHDPTSEDHLDLPAAANFLLRDGDLDRPAGLAFGPLAPAHLTLIADFGLTSRVDELRVLARDPAGRPVLTGGAVEWQVWTSVDGVLWTRLPGASSSFDAGRGHWSVTFPRRTERWVQLVSFFVNDVETEITELQAFFTTTVEDREGERRDSDSWIGGAGLTWRPRTNFRLTLQSALSASRFEPEGGVESENEDVEHSVAAAWDPTRRTSVALQRTQRDSRFRLGAAETDSTLEAWSGLFRYTVNANLYSILEATHSEEDFSAAPAITDRLFVRTWARIFPGLEATLDAGEQRQEIRSLDLEVASPIVGVSVRAYVTPTLQVNALASLRENRYSGAPAGGLPPDDREERWSVDLFWRPGGKLALGALFGKAAARGTSTPLQSYRAQWTPFPGGALRLNAQYDEDVEPVTDRRSRRLMINPYWAINPRTSLRMNYFLQRTSTPGSEDTTQTFQTTFSIDF